MVARHQPVGPAGERFVQAGVAVDVGPQRQKADAAGERLAAGSATAAQTVRHIVHEEALGRRAERDVEQMRDFARGGEEVADQPTSRMRRTPHSLGRPIEFQDLADAGAEALAAPLQVFQHLDPARQAAAVGLQVGEPQPQRVDRLAGAVAVGGAVGQGKSAAARRGFAIRRRPAVSVSSSRSSVARLSAAWAFLALSRSRSRRS